MKNITEKINDLEHAYRRYSLSEEFHDKTKIVKRTKTKSVSKWPQSWLRVNFKGYPRLSSIELGAYDYPGLKQPFDKILFERHSTRSYDHSKFLSKHLISTLLYYVAGIRFVPEGNWDSSKRFYPSPGARYSLEVYPIILGKSEIKKGIYHYNVKQHALEILRLGDFSHEIKSALEPPWLSKVGMLILITAVFGRNQVKYGDRGYRLIFTENGHLGHNFYLVSTAIGLGCCALGGYPDDILNLLLDVDGINESVINAIAIGFPKL